MLGSYLVETHMVACLDLFDGIFCGHNMMCPPVIYTDIYLSLGRELDIVLTMETLSSLEGKKC